MRRRVVGVKKLPSKKNKTLEVPQTSNYLHVKLVFGWGLIVFFDAIVGFRLEYLYPAFMFLRSVLDSYKYHGLVFSMFFILLVLYLDVVCWTLLVGPWLFFIASSCVWLELIRNWDNSFGYASVIVWMFFIYVEISQRLSFLPPSIITLLRPFGAHCIGYPVVAMSFQLKHQLTHVIRQRQQRYVSEENMKCFDILCKALPFEDDEGSEDGSKLSLLSDEGSGQHEKIKNHVKPVAKKDGGVANSNGTSGKGLSLNNKTQTVKSNGNKTTSPVSGASKRDSSPSSKSLDLKMSSNSTSTLLSWKQDVTPISNETIESNHVASVNGDITKSSTSTKLPPIIHKKQALVKAVPRVDLQQQIEAREKATKSSEALAIELKEEKTLRIQLENDVALFEKEVKRLKADLHATSLQEEEANQQVHYLTQQERLLRVESQRLKNETDNLQNRLTKLSSKKAHDMEHIASLEEQLKQEIILREKIETQLREHRSQVSTHNQWSKEEMKEMKERLNRKEKELEAFQSEHQQLLKRYQNLNHRLIDKANECGLLEEQITHLKSSLADETRVKIELFQHLSDARRKQELFVEEIKKKDKEINTLQQKLQHLIALQSTWTPTLSPHH